MTAPMPLPPAARKLRAAALAYPETHEDLPWGHSAIKVRGKMFLVLAAQQGEWTLSVKLPVSFGAALKLENVDPTRYGMGKHRWVTATFGARARVPQDLLLGWMGESYQAIAAKAPARKKKTPAKSTARSAKRGAVKRRTARKPS